MFNVQLLASQLIQQVLLDGRNLNQVLEPQLRQHHDWPANQRAALQDLCYGSLRHYRQLQFMLDQLLHKPLKDELIHCLLLVALYQLQYTQAASHAIVDHAVRATQKRFPHAKGLVNAILRNFLRQQESLEQKASLQLDTRYSYPKWWVQQLQQQYGAQTEAILQAGNEHPPMTLRVNRRKTDVNRYLAQLQDVNIAAHTLSDTAILLQQPVGVDKLPHFFDGWVSVQDAGAQRAATLLDVAPQQRVLDACAAPGGKTAHLLELADLELWAIDKSESRLKRVHENLQRLELHATTRVGDASTPQDWWDRRGFDRILADVPCSASGVVRRHPDIKWLRRPEDIEAFAAQQLAILRALWPLLNAGGKLLYATCSIFDAENEGVIAQFLAATPEAQRLEQAGTGQMLPNSQHDGFFYVLLQKQA